MILECPACKKRYLVDPRSVGLSGRTVRCANCKNEWHAELSDEAREALLQKQQDDAAPAEDYSVEDASRADAEAVISGGEDAAEEAQARRRSRSTNVPAIATPKRAMPMGLVPATLALGVIFLLTAAVYFRPVLLPVLPAAESVYRLFGLYNSDGVVLADLAYQKNEIGTKDSHQFSGVLVNTTQDVRRLPALKIRLMGAEGQVIKNRTFSEVADLQPGEQKEFRASIESSPGSTALVVVEHGNGLELKLRASQGKKDAPSSDEQPQKEETSHDEHE